MGRSDVALPLGGTEECLTVLRSFITKGLDDSDMAVRAAAMEAHKRIG